MSNQVFRNQTKRYSYTKENLYRITVNKAIPNTANGVPLDLDVTDQDQIGTGLTYTAGVFKVVNESAAGLYTFSASVTWAISALGSRQIWLTKNVETRRRGHVTITPTGGFDIYSITQVVDLQLNDEVRIFIEQNAAATLDIIGISRFCNSSVTLMN